MGPRNLRFIKATQESQASCHLTITHLSSDISAHFLPAVPPTKKCSLLPEILQTFNPFLLACVHSGAGMPLSVRPPFRPLSMLEGLLLVFPEPVKESHITCEMFASSPPRKSRFYTSGPLWHMLLLPRSPCCVLTVFPTKLQTPPAPDLRPAPL